MNPLALLGPAAALLAALVWAERGQRPALVLMFKAPLSALFVAAAWLSPHPLSGYAWLVLTGLCLGLVGDVCLALPGVAAFRAGLAAFLLGHLCYVPAFAMLTRPGDWQSPLPLVLAAVSLAVWFWLRPKVGQLKVPVIAYIAVITAMVIAALVAFQNSLLPVDGAWAVFLGALAFYLSDLCVARDRFAAPGWINRLVGLPLYYGGQFAIAFSVGLVA